MLCQRSNNRRVDFSMEGSPDFGVDSRRWVDANRNVSQWSWLIPRPVAPCPVGLDRSSHDQTSLTWSDWILDLDDDISLAVQTSA
jgi:hypothetical protein